MIRRLAVPGMLAWLMGCAAAPCKPLPHVILTDDRGGSSATVETLLAAHPLAPGQNISSVALGQTASASYHLVQIRDREPAHVHATHDLAVTLLRGTGQVHIRDQTIEMRAGDVAVVPRGTPHYFVNGGAAPAVTFATFAPPYDGKDQVPVDRGP